MRKLILPIAAAAMAVSPVAASAAQVERGTEAVEAESELGGTSTIVAILAALAVIAGIIVAVDDNDDEPVSI